VWLRYSDVGLFSQPDDLSQTKLGTFYQVLDAASGLEVRPCKVSTLSGRAPAC
jgi:hypothetical protein